MVAENEVGRDQTHCVVNLTPVSGIDQSPIVNPNAFKYLEQHAPIVRHEEIGDPKIPPKVSAGAIQTVNININEIKHCIFIPSVISLLYF